MHIDCSRLSDAELISSLKTLVNRARADLIMMLEHLAEFDRRSLAGKSGFSSLFAYCTQELRCSEGEAARRIHAARAAARFPVLYRLLGCGSLSLTAVSLLAPHLTKENWRPLLRQAIGKSTREVEALVAGLVPGQKRRDSIRYAGTIVRTPPGPESLAQTQTAPAQQEGAIKDALFSSATGMRQNSWTPAAGQAHDTILSRLVHISFTADEKLLRKLSRAKELLRHKHPRASLEEVFDEALEALLKRLDPEQRDQQRSKARAPQASQNNVANVKNTNTRCIPQWIRDEVWKRDQGACSFASPSGRRCGERGGLEYDHVLPWAKGGRSDDATNIRLLCRAHNQLEAKRIFGDAVVETAILRQRKWLRERRGIGPSWSRNAATDQPP